MTHQLSFSADQDILRQAELERARVLRQSVLALWSWLFVSRAPKAPVGPAIGVAAE